jgi:carbon monoxide dehydrogenase subunit G
LNGKRRRRATYALLSTCAAAAFASPAVAAAESAEEGTVVESLAPSRGGPWGFWTQERLESAEPLPVVTLPEPGATEASNPTEAPAEESAPLGEASGRARTSAVEGIEVAASESTVFPNSANGKLFGTFETRIPGTHEFSVKEYVCSASVVKMAQTPKEALEGTVPGNVVVTAGHCAIDPETGTVTSTKLIFIPGYRNGTAPYGVWHAESFVTTETWKKTAVAGTRSNEGGDVAFILLKGESVEKAVGSLGIAFDQACNQTYTQFGYPAEPPYGGELLYSHTAPYVGADTPSGFTPVPMKIASDFTRGSSGGPWAVGVGGATPPTVLSVTAYGYENQPGYLFGPYFGEATKKAYGVAIGKTLPAGIEETCQALPVTPVETPTTPVTPAPTPTPAAPAPTKTPETKTPVYPVTVTLKVNRVHRRANGSAVVTAQVSTAGMLKLSGSAVRAESFDTPAAGTYKMVVAPKASTTRKLRQRGKAKVGISVAFVASGRIERVSRQIQLSRRAAAPAPR